MFCPTELKWTCHRKFTLGLKAQEKRVSCLGCVWVTRGLRAKVSDSEPSWPLWNAMASDEAKTRWIVSNLWSTIILVDSGDFKYFGDNNAISLHNNQTNR